MNTAIKFPGGTVSEITFTQKPHCCAPDDTDPEFRISSTDGGGGPYLIINVTEWALDNKDEIAALADYLNNMLDNLPPTP